MSNPRKLKLVPLDAAQLPRSLDDLTAAAINNDYADQAGLVPARDAIGREAADGPYANLIAVRARTATSPGSEAGGGLPVARGSRLHREGIQGLAGARVLTRPAVLPASLTSGDTP